MHDPANRPSRHLPSELGLGLMTALLLAPFVWSSDSCQDEFTLLSDGLRALSGEVIYRDFFQFIGPITHWIAAAAFLPAGPSLVAARVAAALLMLLASWQLYHLGRRLALPPWVATLPALILTVALYRLLPGFSHHWLVLPFVLGALLFAMRGSDGPGLRWWALAGAAAAGATLTVQSDGLVLVLIGLGFLLLQGLLGGWTRRRLARSVGAYALGGLAPLLLVAGYFGSLGALGDLWYHVWTWPLSHYKTAGGYNDLKFAMDLPGLIGDTRNWVSLSYWYGRAYHFLLLAVVPLAAAAIALPWGIGLLWRRIRTGAGWSPAEARLGLVVLAALGSLALAVRGRADLTHVAVYAVPAVLLTTVAAQAARRRLSAPEWVAVRWLPLACLWLFAGTGAMLYAQQMRQDPQNWLSLASPDERIQARPALRYLLDHLGPDDRVAGAPYPGPFYFYTRRPASRYTLMLPPELGYNTEAEYKAFWQDMRQRQPRYLVVSPWRGEQGLWQYMRYPLPGYREVARKRFSPGGSADEVFIFQRTP